MKLLCVAPCMVCNFTVYIRLEALSDSDLRLTVREFIGNLERMKVLCGACRRDEIMSGTENMFRDIKKPK